MNNTYSIIYNAALGEYQVASEKTKTRRSKARKLATVALLGAFLTPVLAQPFNITNIDPAIIASTNNWENYDFQTTAITNQFFPIYSSVIGSEDNWGTRLATYVIDPTNQAKKTAFDTANSDLQTNVNNYFTLGNGYLKVNTDKTFGFTARANETNETKVSNNRLIAVSVDTNKSLKYMSDNQLGETSYYTNRLFNIASNGTLIMQTDAGASIEINGFGINEPGWTNGGAISNAGNAYFGSSVKFIDNVVYSYDGGAIYNTGVLHIGSSAEFSSNRAGRGGAIYNNTGGNVYLGSNTTFSNNSSSSSFSPTGGAIYNNTDGNIYLGSNATFSNNSSSWGGAISNLRGNIYVGSNATFSDNYSNEYGGAIQNQGNIYLGSNTTFINNSTVYNGAAINQVLGNLNIDTGIQGETTLFTGNLAVGQSNSISMSGGTLNITGSGTLDMRDPFSSYSSSSSINKTGTSTWKLAGENLGGSVNTNNNVFTRWVTLNIDEGTLYLYKAGEEKNPNHNDLNAEVGAGNINNLVAMNLANGAKLIAGGGNELTGTTLNIHAGSTLGFKVGDINTTAPVMKWGFDTVNLVGTGAVNVDILSTPTNAGKYYLLQSSTHPANFEAQSYVLHYFGFDANKIDRLQNHFQLDRTLVGGQYNVYLDYAPIETGTATWNSTASTANWDVGSENWNVSTPSGATHRTFVSRDAVIFGDLGLKDQTININAAGSEFELNGMSVNSATNYTFNGDGLALMAGKNITKNGTGILAFNNRVKGDVALQGGKLIIGDSSQYKNAYLEGTVTAQSGTIVGGHGTIAGIVNIGNGATLSPGNSIGTITVGELNLQDGARVSLDVLPTGESDKIAVKKLGTTSGNVNIGSGVYLDLIAGAGQWSPSTSYSFMTAEGTISGRFAGVTSNLAFLTGTLTVDANGLPTLIINRNNIDFALFANTYNQRAVANALQIMPQNHAVYQAVVGMSGEQARLAYDNLSGELYASTENVLFHNATKLQDGMLSRIHEGTDGLWIKGWGHNSHIKGDGNAAKVENKGAGLLLGYDFNLNQNILIGAAVGFEDSKIKIKDHNRKGENKVKSTHFMVYGNADLEVLEVKAGLSYSALRFKANRYINIPTLAGNLHSKYHGHQIHFFIEGSKTFNVLENYDVAPYLNLAYTDVKTKSFVEEGSQAALSSKGQSNNRTSLTLGVKNDWYFDTERNLGVTADIGWKHTFGDKTLDKRFNFVNTNTDFKIKSASVNKNSAVIGLGFKGKYQDLTIDVGYQGEFNNKVKDHAFGAKVKWSF